MDELPADAPKKLPDHPKTEKNGTTGTESCSGGEATDIYSDVGLIYASCPDCSASFVYLPAKKTWMAENEFEKLLTENPPDVGELNS